MKKYNKESIYKAKKLRKESTKEENHLWYDFLRGHKLKFVRQKSIGNYILDFYCSEKKLAIEIDGSQHFEPANFDYDANRTKILNEYGISVLRFTNGEINKQFEAVCEYINEFIKKIDSKKVINDSIIQRV